MQIVKTLSALLVFISLGISTVNAQQRTTVKQWLTAGPASLELPAFHNESNMAGKKFSLADLLEFEPMEIGDLWPAENDALPWSKEKTLKWRPVSADAAGYVVHTASAKSVPEVSYFAAFIAANRWTKAVVEVSSTHLFSVYADGRLLESKSGSERQEAEKIRIDLKLEKGKHLLLIKSLRDPENPTPWGFHAVIETDSAADPEALKLSVSSKRTVTILDILDGAQPQDVAVSPDGGTVAITLSSSLPPTDGAESWIELRNTKTGKLMRTFRGGMTVSNPVWLPGGNRFSYILSDKLWLYDMDAGTNTPILEDVSVESHAWSPDGSYVIYSVSEPAPAEQKGVKKLSGMTDRWPGWRSRSFLYQLNVDQGTRRRLTSGLFSTSLQGISPDGKKILFSVSKDDLKQRPFLKDTYWTLEPETMTLDSLFTVYWSNGAVWSPDGRQLLVLGSAAMFGDIGVSVPEDAIPNDYDTQAFLYDLSSEKVVCITRNFDPSINDAVWVGPDKAIYFRTVDRSYINLYRYDTVKGSFTKLNTETDVVTKFSVGKNRAVAAYVGSSVSDPPKVYVHDKQDGARVIADYGKTRFRNVDFGKVERWTFKNKAGSEIEGRVYYPPGFDSSQKYPCIVYYYGGTSPVERDFGGRYPKNVWAAQGYVVYVLQPSGATGFGQAFSALHVNNWGKSVADEIIEGTKSFLAEHEFVDAKRVGCIGASYGGFITMLLQTRTDIFAAAIAHAGISSIAGYWGEGFWGYLYSAAATAGSFPWNRKDIYVDQSPLFNADKVSTPTLLLHGTSDTNVPPGESIQFFTALRILGKEVELIEFDGQGHHILAYQQRIVWSKTIMAWFDRWLKSEPAWWNDLYPR